MKTSKAVTHQGLLAVRPALDTDYAGFGGDVFRYENAALAYPDCSMGCKWAAWLQGRLGNDWCVCAKPGGPRQGLLTFEHQAGFGCFER